MKILLSLFILVSVTASAQKIEQSEIDKFTKQKRILTSTSTLKARMVEGIAVYIRSVDTSIFMVLRGFGPGTGVIGSNDRAIFLLDDESTVDITSTGIQSYDISTKVSSYKHQYYVSIESLKTLSQHNVKSIRKYTSEGYADIEIPEKNQDEIKKLATVFLAEYNK